MNPLLIFGEDWGRHNSGCQRITLELLLRGHRITWVNTIGTRRPSLNFETVVRGAEKMRQWCFQRRKPSMHLSPTVLAPIMWPSLHHTWERRFNARILEAQLRGPIGKLNGLPIVVTKVPLPPALVERLPAERWIYYNVDHVSEWPGCDREALFEMENAIIQKADSIIVANQQLQNRIRTHGRESTVLTHGVDLDLWQSPVTDLQLPDYERPLMVFWGLIDQRLDVEFIRHLGQTLKTGTILLTGPKQSPHPDLLQCPRVHYHRAIDYLDLPALGSKADVLIMPYLRNDVTHYMQPVKLTEYMATGKPVVSSSIPAAVAWDDCISVADSKEEFVALVMQLIQEGLPVSQTRARSRLESEGWPEKASRFLSLIQN